MPRYRELDQPLFAHVRGMDARDLLMRPLRQTGGRSRSPTRPQLQPQQEQPEPEPEGQSLAELEPARGTTPREPARGTTPREPARGTTPRGLQGQSLAELEPELAAAELEPPVLPLLDTVDTLEYDYGFVDPFRPLDGMIEEGDGTI